MDIFISFSDGLPCGLDVVEDELNEVLQDCGEVTGTGTGVSGSNFDIEIDEDAIPAEAALKAIRAALRRVGVTTEPRIKMT